MMMVLLYFHTDYDIIPDQPDVSNPDGFDIYEITPPKKQH